MAVKPIYEAIASFKGASKRQKIAESKTKVCIKILRIHQAKWQQLRKR
jgi:hypothetical protein